MRTTIPSAYILVKVLLKYLHQATTANSGFNGKGDNWAELTGKGDNWTKLKVFSKVLMKNK